MSHVPVVFFHFEATDLTPCAVRVPHPYPAGNKAFHLPYVTTQTSVNQRDVSKNMFSDCLQYNNSLL